MMHGHNVMRAGRVAKISSLFALFALFRLFLLVGIRHKVLAVYRVLFLKGFTLDLHRKKHGSLEDFELRDVDYVRLVIGAFFSELLASIRGWFGEIVSYRHDLLQLLLPVSIGGVFGDQTERSLEVR